MQAKRTLRRRRCEVCGEGNFTYENRGDRRAVSVPDGRVHFRCLGAWLLEWALGQWFPRADQRELEVVRKRLGLDDVRPERLPKLREVGQSMQRTGARVSQIQRDAMARFERTVDDGVVVLHGELARRILEEVAEHGQTPTELVSDAITRHHRHARRKLSFAALGKGRPGFRAADAESVLEREFGA